MNHEYKRTRQRYIAMIGDVSVGKTTLAQRYIKEDSPLDQNIKVKQTEFLNFLEHYRSWYFNKESR